MNDELAAKAATRKAMKEFLDRSIGEVNRSVDEGSVSVPLLAGLALAHCWLAELMPGDGWETFCRRLHQAVTVVASAPDAGSVTQFGLWDGLKAAESHARHLASAEAA